MQQQLVPLCIILLTALYAQYTLFCQFIVLNVINLPVATLGHFDLKPGMRVVAKWRDNNWYAATVRKKTAKRVSLAFMDGDNDSAAVQYVLPLVSQWRLNNMLWWLFHVHV